MNEIPGRHPSGVRLAGDEYQHLVTWNEVLLALRPGSGATAMTVEARDAGNVDDVVVTYAARPTTYTQVKHAVDATTPVGTDWLTRSQHGGRSLLRRFLDSWRGLRDAGLEPAMQLVTDREVDSDDPLMRLLDRRTELLVPSIEASTAGDVAVARSAWAAHLQTEERELLDLLGALRFRTGRPFNAELERADSLMWGHGLSTGRGAIDSAIALVRDWVQERWRTIDLEELRRRVNERIGWETDPGALLIIEAIDDDLHPEDAVELLRWVERYEGDDPNLRRQLREPADWNGVIAPELNAAAERLRAAGHRRVLVRGALRLPTWFAAGASLRHVRGFDVAALQHGEIWASDTASGRAPRPEVVTAEVGDKDDLAVAIGIAVDPTAGALRFISEQQLPVGRFAVLMPPDGPSPQAVTNGPAASLLAVGLRDAVRDLVEDRFAERIHLFLAMPGGLALLLGHRWNALRPTVVYEHLGPGIGYVETVTVPA